MSNVSTIFDNFLALLQTEFASKTQLANPFSVQNNNDNILKEGYGLRYGPASLPDFDLTSFQGYSREIVVILTKQVFKTDNDTDNFSTAQKAMVEDQNTLINSLAKNRTFDSSTVSVEFTGDSGIEFIFNGKFNFLYLETSFEIQYKEDKNYCYP